MEITQLFNELAGTTIQKSEHFNKFLNYEIIIPSSIYNIEDNNILLYETWRSDGRFENYTVDLSFDKEKFMNQLLNFSQGDDVIIKAKPQSVIFGYYSMFKFDLISIEKIGTTIQSRAEEEMKERKRLEKKKDKGCFIATACYGDFNAPEVVTLRNYRDTYLNQSFLGRFLINVYYSFSPFLASIIIKSEKLKNGVRSYILKPIITNLQKKISYNVKTETKQDQNG
jgi:hypothetical protein